MSEPEAEDGSPVTVGVEEEFLLVDAATGRPAPRIAEIFHDEPAAEGVAQKELHRAQIETATPACHTLEEVRGHLVEGRRRVAELAGRYGIAVVASGTYPGKMGGAGRLITADDRYEAMADANALLAKEQLICGCHVHASVTDPEMAIRVMNAAGRWAPCLVALTANSPFWEGEDTGFASYRSEVWARWPTAGPTGYFESRADYESLLDRLIEGGVILDRGMAYWDIRPSHRYPTVEFRVADVGLAVDDAVLLAALVRALVDRCVRQEGRPAPLRVEMLRAAKWRAARLGLSGRLIDPRDGSAHEADDMIGRFLEYLRPSLERFGDWEEVSEACSGILADGNGADRQRRAFRRHRRLEDVLSLATLAGGVHPPEQG